MHVWPVGGNFDGQDKWMRPLFDALRNSHSADAHFHLGRLEEAKLTSIGLLTNDQVTSGG